MKFCPSLFHSQRRKTRVVRVGDVALGGANPIRVQSMITCDTMDTAASIQQTLDLAAVGCEIVRITAPTVKDAANLQHIVAGLRQRGCNVPIVADIHFKPDAAMEAAKWVEKVRVNPGNYADSKKFAVKEYTDADYAAELERIHERFSPLVTFCKEHGRAMRIGTNHGSLSDRIMNRYGDTPLGMCESALEFARLARENDYHNFVFSMKASNPKVMIEAYRLLVARLDAEGPDWNYPIHLGVTEAGDGEDGRIKSAIGIGSLLADGIGDTIRVSLTEDAIHEIPVAQALAAPFNAKGGGWDFQSQPTLNTLAQTIRPNWSQLEKRTSTYLPHWRIPGATYAVTFRTKDSLPSSVLKEYEREKSLLLARIDCVKNLTDAGESLQRLRKEICTLMEAVIEPALHSAEGPRPLANPAIAAMVESALKHFNDDRYDLLAWSVMPNHVHVLLTPREGHELEKIIQSWKTHSATQANRMLGKSGTFWQEEYYDHIVRDGEDLKHQVNYILANPGKGWASGEWTGSCLWLGLPVPVTYDPFSYERRASSTLTIMGHELGGEKTVRVFTTQERWNSLAHKIAGMGDFKPEIILEKSGVVAIDPRDEAAISAINSESEPRLVTVADGLDLEVIHAFRQLAFRVNPRHPVLLKDTLHPPVGETEFIQALLPAAQNIGSLLCDGIGDAILVRGETAPGQSLRLAYNILQAAGTRIFKTDYVACPSCGRTLFNLQHTTQKIRAATGHLKGVRIAVMGCIVNGPGEMADADFGYVGGAPNKINLYVGKTAVKFNIPEAEAVSRLTDLIREHGKWVDAPEPAAAEV